MKIIIYETIEKGIRSTESHAICFSDLKKYIYIPINYNALFHF